MQVKNKNYVEFLETGMMKTLDIDIISKALDNVKGVRGLHIDEHRSFLITSYYTGARPVEILSLRQGDVWKEENYILFKIPAAKNGKTRILRINYKRRHIKECYLYCWHQFPGVLLYPNMIGSTIKYVTLPNGVKKKYIEKTRRIRYYMKHWFDTLIDDGIPPYYLRHNRFSKTSLKGGSTEDIMIMKGAKDIKSAQYYIHMNAKKSKQLARIID